MDPCTLDGAASRNTLADECRWDHKTPAQFREASRAELKDRYPGQCTFVDGEVRTINALEPLKGQTGTQFEAILTSGEVFKAQKVILASGCRDILPFIDGFEECWGTGVVHCLLCHGHEERGVESVGILALDAFAEPSTLLRVLRTCKQFAARVHIYTHGNGRAAASLKEVTALVPGVTVESKEIDVLEMVDPAGERPSDIRVVLENGQQQQHGFLLYHTATEQASELVTELGIELDDGGDIKLGAFQETSVRGIFAAGDCASTQKYVAIASAMGTMAGAGAAQQLQAEKTYDA